MRTATRRTWSCRSPTQSSSRRSRPAAPYVRCRSTATTPPWLSSISADRVFQQKPLPEDGDDCVVGDDDDELQAGVMVCPGLALTNADPFVGADRGAERGEGRGRRADGQ